LSTWWSIGWAALWVFVLLVASGVAFLLLQIKIGSESADWRRSSSVLCVLFGTLIVGLFSPTLLPLQNVHDWMILDLVAFGSAFAAGLFGFLFGLPKTVVSASQPDGAILTPSTNLESVADGLTKYITGAAFASLAVAASYVDHAGVIVQHALAGAPEWGRIAADSMIVTYGVIGFLLSYVLTRTVGSFEFLQADRRVLDQAYGTIRAILPDVGDQASDEQKALAAKVAAYPFSAMQTIDEQLSWARAQTILKAWDKARVAYAMLYGSNPTNATVLIEYATALYNDPSFDNCPFILDLAERALAIPNISDDVRSRIAALRAATYLYVKGGYVQSITIVNDALALGATSPTFLPTKTMHFYRACGFGQLYRAYRPFVPPAGDQVAQRIIMDCTVTVGFGPKYSADILGVCNGSGSGAGDSKDDDLQAFAAANPTLQALLNIQAPPAPDPATAPPQVPIPGNLSPDAFAASCPP
jgi:hypothetical protein